MNKSITDSLHVAQEVLRQAAYLGLTRPEPWKIVILSLTIVFSFSIEPIVVTFMVRYAEFREYMKKTFENSDGKPNTEDVRNFLAYWIGILFIGRCIVIASFWSIFFGSDLTELILVLAGIMISIITGNAIIGNVTTTKRVNQNET
jgi:hypothetical protein